MCCAHIASLVPRPCFATQSDAYLTRVVRLLLIMRFNVRKWGRMTGRTVKMETWVGAKGQGLYRVELHYNRIDRRRRHTLSHNLGLPSRLKYISHSWIQTTLCPDDVRQFNRNTHVKLPGTQNMANARHWHLLMSVVLNVSFSTTRTPMRHVTWQVYHMYLIPFFEFHLQCPVQLMKSWIS